MLYKLKQLLIYCKHLFFPLLILLLLHSSESNVGHLLWHTAYLWFFFIWGFCFCSNWLPLGENTAKIKLYTFILHCRFKPTLLKKKGKKVGISYFLYIFFKKHLYFCWFLWFFELWSICNLCSSWPSRSTCGNVETQNSARGENSAPGGEDVTTEACPSGWRKGSEKCCLTAAAAEKFATGCTPVCPAVPPGEPPIRSCTAGMPG